MKILAVETSCDETALCIIEGTGETSSPRISVLGTSLFSQAKIHEQYGGVFPNLAKREHARNLVPLLKNLLENNNLSLGAHREFTPEQHTFLQKLLEREPDLYTACSEYLQTCTPPDIDAIAVTVGPGLEPALWVGINFAKALSYIWGKPIVPVNHMEGHIASVLTASSAEQSTPVVFPALALLISGGHTELVLVRGWSQYEVVGQTRDDAVGEAFDKVARMLSLPYPGGPHISRLAHEARTSNAEVFSIRFPRPMLHSGDLDFSFSGLKTAVLTAIQKTGDLTDDTKKAIAREFEDAVVEVLREKTMHAIERYNIRTLIIGGGVIANTRIREAFAELHTHFPELTLLLPEKGLETDNAVMIAIAGYLQAQTNPHTLSTDPNTIRAQGNLSL